MRPIVQSRQAAIRAADACPCLSACLAIPLNRVRHHVREPPLSQGCLHRVVLVIQCPFAADYAAEVFAVEDACAQHEFIMPACEG
jgi:hypothetical protein